MDDFREKLNLDELYDRREEVHRLKTEVFKRVLQRVHTRIKLTARQNHGQLFCFFLVPEFLVGLPRYDSAACIAYLMDKLLDNGFFVKYTHPNLVFISWQHYMPRRQRLEFRNQYGFTIDGFGNRVKKHEVGKPSAAPTDPNTLILKRPNVPLTIKKKDYKQVTTYKPTGNFIYNAALLKRIEDGGKPT